MKHIFVSIKIKTLELYKLLKELEQMPLRRLRGEFSDEEESEPSIRAPRSNNVKVEDLRPDDAPMKSDS